MQMSFRQNFYLTNLYSWHEFYFPFFMKLKVTEFAALIFSALVMGVFWGTWFTLTRSIPDFSAAEFIHIGKTIIANVAIPMRILMPATLLLMLLTIWQCRRVNRASFYLYVLSFLLMVATLIITVVVEVPIDNQIKTWTEAIVPANWESLRHTWDTFHTIRTFTSIISVCFFAWGMVKRIR
jgi:uncharacterized membrane protein